MNSVANARPTVGLTGARGKPIAYRPSAIIAFLARGFNSPRVALALPVSALGVWRTSCRVALAPPVSAGGVGLSGAAQLPGQIVGRRAPAAS